MILTTSADNAKPIFCGIISSSRVYRKEGRHAAMLEVRSYSWLMDRDKKKISFQQSGRTWKALADMVLSPYGGIYTWDQPGKDQTVGDFLMQYEETDWEFLCRIAARQFHPVYPEVRVTGVKICVGLPQNRESRQIETNRYRIRSRMDGAWQEEEKRGLVASLEYITEELDEDIALGEPVMFLQRSLWVVEKKSYLKSGILLHDYVLRPQDYCRVKCWQNERLSGAAVGGVVTAISPAMSRLSVFCQVLFLEKTIRIPCFRQGVFPALGGHLIRHLCA